MEFELCNQDPVYDGCVLIKTQLDIYRDNMYRGVRKIHFVLSDVGTDIDVVRQWCVIEFMRHIIGCVSGFQQIALVGQIQRIRAVIHMDERMWKNCRVIRTSLNGSSITIPITPNLSETYCIRTPVFWDKYSTLFYHNNKPITPIKYNPRQESNQYLW